MIRSEDSAIPTQITVYEDLNLIWVRAWDEVTAFDLRAARDQAFSSKDQAIMDNMFLDLRDVTGITFGFTEVLATNAAASTAVEQTGRLMKVSCHAINEVSFGVARMYEQLMTSSGNGEAMVTGNRSEALEWLGLQYIPDELI